MSANYIVNKVEEIGSLFHQMKEQNDRRLSDLETKGNSDPLTMENINRLNRAIDDQKAFNQKLEMSVNRPFSGGVSGVVVNEATHQHKQAFCSYLRKGIDDALPMLEKKALSLSSDNEGGYFVTSTIAETLSKIAFESSPMRRVASVINISTDAYEVIQDNDDMSAGWTTETGAISETDSPDLGKKLIPVFEIYAQPKATQKLIDDSSVDIEQWLTDRISDVFNRKENSAFIVGDGIGKPRGILSYANGTNWGQIEQIASGSDALVTPDGLIKLFYSLKDTYAVNASFMMNRASIQQVRLLKETTTGQYLWNPGIAAGAPDTLLGLPVYQAADMPVPTTGSLSVAVGDFSRAYQIVDRRGVRVLRDPYTEKPFVKFYTTKRVGGDVVNFEAIKLLKLSVA